MKKIGEWLKARRLELGFSIDEIVHRTRISPVHIKAIEEGNIDYFKDDLSYLKFFLQYYCRAVYYNYDDIAEEVDQLVNEFNQTQLLKLEEQRAQSNQNIQDRIQTHSREKRVTMRRINPVGVIVVAISGLVLLLLIFGFFKLVLPLLLPQKPTYVGSFLRTPEFESGIRPLTKKASTKPPVLDAGQDKEKEKPEDNKEPVGVEREGVNNYHVKFMADQRAVLHVDFSVETWISVTKDGVLQKTPVSRVYQANESIDIELDPKESSNMSLVLGVMAGNRLRLDGKEVDLDPSIAQSNSGVTLNFFLESGKKDELTQ